MPLPEPTPAAVPATHRQVLLAARPEDTLTTDHFEVTTAPVPEPGPGQVLVRNRLMNVAAVMRPLTIADPDSFALTQLLQRPGNPMHGPAIGEVVTAAPGTDLAPGELVRHRLGWREYAVVDAAEAERLSPGALPDPAAYLSQGFAAWLGVVRGAEVRDGDTVFVSGAAGGVGTLAGQFARLHGAARVIGSTGSPRKAEYLVKELGYDAAVVRGAGPIEDQLREAAPDGIDALFDNVGGEQLLAALAVARRGARFALVGALSAQLTGDAMATVPISTFDLIARGITLRGTAAFDHMDAYPQYEREFGRALSEGTMTYPHTRLRGVEQAPRALCELVEGRHVGAVLVEL
ncbi:MDR family NADP-dependent oxidoreductase [Streptomyces sp. NPDC020845]|uniref:MDR family NADP-dependent oxidoreductase n=1 Tax=Streptomyces sp. NPDC020845 TaxID=3365096 RepID=UPI0037B34956